MALERARRQDAGDGAAEGGVTKAAARERRRAWLRVALSMAYFAAGVLHLVLPRPFVSITPDWVPNKEMVIALTGLAEIAGALALTQPRWPKLRRAGAVGLALYALCVFPANVSHMLMDMVSTEPVLGWVYHGPRMLLQPVLIWLALWVSGAPRRT